MTSSIFKDNRTVPQWTLQSGQINLPWSINDGGFFTPPLDIPTQSYGQYQDSLDATMALRNLSTSGNYYAGSFTRASWSTGNQSITGVWFQPKMIKVTWLVAWTNTSTCWGSSNGTNTQCTHYNFNGGSLLVSHSTTQLINLDIGSQTDATLVSFDTDGFTINWSFINSNVIIDFECYG